MHAGARGSPEVTRTRTCAVKYGSEVGRVPGGPRAGDGYGGEARRAPASAPRSRPLKSSVCLDAGHGSRSCEHVRRPQPRRFSGDRSSSPRMSEMAAAGEEAREDDLLPRGSCGRARAWTSTAEGRRTPVIISKARRAQGPEVHGPPRSPRQMWWGRRAQGRQPLDAAAAAVCAPPPTPPPPCCDCCCGAEAGGASKESSLGPGTSSVPTTERVRGRAVSPRVTPPPPLPPLPAAPTCKVLGEPVIPSGGCGPARPAGGSPA